MISYSVYKVLHLTGVFMILVSLGSLAIQTLLQSKIVWKRPLALVHGFGMVMALVGGFGLLARLGVMHESLPGWIYAKLAIWLFLGALMGVIPRKPNWARGLWGMIIVLGGLGAYLAQFKPF